MIAIVVLLCLGAVYLYSQYVRMPITTYFFGDTQSIRVAGVPVTVEVADTAAKREQGLSERSSIGAADALLFVFPESGYHGIWMEDMQFPIDIIWIAASGEIVHIEQDVRPDSYPEIFEPDYPALYVLETDDFFTETYNITTDDTVEIPARLRAEN